MFINKNKYTKVINEGIPLPCSYLVDIQLYKCIVYSSYENLKETMVFNATVLPTKVTFDMPYYVQKIVKLSIIYIEINHLNLNNDDPIYVYEKNNLCENFMSEHPKISFQKDCDDINKYKAPGNFGKIFGR